MITEDPGQLTASWDSLFGGHPLKSRIFLRHLKATNPIGQRYYWQGRDGDCLAGCVYRAELPFRAGPLSICRPASFCGVPMPFGIEAGFAPSDKVEAAVGLMDNAWPGFQIILGLSERGPDIPGWSWKRHLPGVVFRSGYDDFGDYLASLRHNYRKLLNRSLRKWSGIRVVLSDGSDFGDEEYRQYLEVLNRQRFRTEALGKGFFSGIPVGHVYIKAYAGKSLISWILLVPYGTELYALFLGVDKACNETYHSYFNIFLETIKYAIARNYKVIHFGQTAEFTKMRLGGESAERYILVRHTNRAINAVIRNSDIFNYRRHYPIMHVLKRDENDGR